MEKSGLRQTRPHKLKKLTSKVGLFSLKENGMRTEVVKKYTTDSIFKIVVN
jgi:hypothetical protein